MFFDKFFIVVLCCGFILVNLRSASPQSLEFTDPQIVFPFFRIIRRTALAFSGYTSESELLAAGRSIKVGN